MAWRPKGRSTFRVWVYDAAGTRRRVRSTGRVVEADALAVERAVARWQGSEGEKLARPALLDAILDGTLELADAYEAELEGTLKALLERATAIGGGRDLHPLVTEWHAWKAKQTKGAKSADAYRTQLRALFPAGTPFRAGDFTRGEIAKRLDALPHQSPTKNRYRAACSSFAKFLVRREVLSTNPVRDIEGFGEGRKRVVYYTRAQAKALLATLAPDVAHVAALACGFGAEWGAIAAATPEDLWRDPTDGRYRFHARGTKAAARDRIVPLVPENRWLIPYLQAGTVVTLSETQALRRQQQAARTAKIVAHGEAAFSQHTLHDWRHTHAVQLLRDGYSEQIAAAHLGHENTDQVRTRYAVFVPTASDYKKPTRRRPATALATRARTHTKDEEVSS